MLRDITAASSPSARNHFAPGFTPTSRNSVARGTPVHWLLLVRPSMIWGGRAGRGPREAAAPFPEHARKQSREIAGKRCSAAGAKTLGRPATPRLRGL